MSTHAIIIGEQSFELLTPKPWQRLLFQRAYFGARKPLGPDTPADYRVPPRIDQGITCAAVGLLLPPDSPAPDYVDQPMADYGEAVLEALLAAGVPLSDFWPVAVAAGDVLTDDLPSVAEVAAAKDFSEADPEPADGSASSSDAGPSETPTEALT